MKQNKRSPTSKSRDKAIEQMYQSVLKSILSTIVPYCPKEILIEISSFINTTFYKLKDRVLDTIMENDTVKKRESAWNDVTKKVIDILHPLIQAINAEQKPLLQVSNSSLSGDSNTLNHAIKEYAQSRSAEKKNSQIYWPIPLEINFLQIKDADDVATIYCKIGGLVIPCAMIDTGSDSSIFSKNIAEAVEELLGIKINREKTHRLNGVASHSISIGTMDNVPITIGFGENTDTITEAFSVVPAEKDQNGNAKSLVILGTQWQYRAGWEPLIKGEFRATRNGRTITIPLSVHKSQRNVFTVGKDPEIVTPVKKK